MSTTPHRNEIMRSTGLALVIAALAAVGLAGCGESGSGLGSGSGSGSSQSAVNGAAGSSASAPLTIGPGGAAESGVATARYGVKASHARATLTPATKASTAPSRRFFERSVRTKDAEETTPSSERIINPCAVVTQAEAQAALGTRLLKPIKAPLGPTCIFQAPNHQTFASVAVVARPFAQLPSQDKTLRKFAGVKESAYCGGPTRSTSLFVRVAADEVLQISAPCQTAAKMAPYALARLRTVSGTPVTKP
jgi:hypothetical protein